MTTELGLSLFVLTSIVVLTVIIWRVARALDRFDSERADAVFDLQLLKRDLDDRVRERTA